MPNENGLRLTPINVLRRLKKTTLGNRGKTYYHPTCFLATVCGGVAGGGSGGSMVAGRRVRTVCSRIPPNDDLMICSSTSTKRSCYGATVDGLMVLFKYYEKKVLPKFKGMTLDDLKLACDPTRTVNVEGLCADKVVRMVEPQISEEVVMGDGGEVINEADAMIVHPAIMDIDAKIAMAKKEKELQDIITKTRLDQANFEAEKRRIEGGSIELFAMKEAAAIKIKSDAESAARALTLEDKLKAMEYEATMTLAIKKRLALAVHIPCMRPEDALSIDDLKPLRTILRSMGLRTLAATMPKQLSANVMDKYYATYNKLPVSDGIEDGVPLSLYQKEFYASIKNVVETYLASSSNQCMSRV